MKRNARFTENWKRCVYLGIRFGPWSGRQTSGYRLGTGGGPPVSRSGVLWHTWDSTGVDQSEGTRLLDSQLGDWASLVAQWSRNPPANAEDTSSTPGKIPWRRKWQSTLVFLPRKSHGQRSLAGLQSRGSQSVGYDWATEKQQSLGIAGQRPEDAQWVTSLRNLCILEKYLHLA